MFVAIVEIVLKDEKKDDFKTWITDSNKTLSKFDGFVSRRELRTAITGMLKDEVKMKDLDAMITTFDKNGDGVISLDEFLEEMEEKQPETFIPKLPKLAPPPKDD